MNKRNIHFVSQISFHPLWLFYLQNEWNARNTFLDFLSNLFKIILFEKIYSVSLYIIYSPNDIFLRLIKPNGEYVFCLLAYKMDYDLLTLCIMVSPRLLRPTIIDMAQWPSPSLGVMETNYSSFIKRAKLPLLVNLIPVFIVYVCLIPPIFQ